MSKNKMSDVETKQGILYRKCNDFPEYGVTFIDLTPSLINPNYRMSILSKMVNYIENHIGDVDAIICPDARGFLWGTGVATLMNCSLIPVRKTGKLPANCVFNTVTYNTEYSSTSLDLPLTNVAGLKLVFVDDVYATGGTYKACKELVEQAGGTLVGGVVVYNVGINENKDIISVAERLF